MHYRNCLLRIGVLAVSFGVAATSAIARDDSTYVVDQQYFQGKAKLYIQPDGVREVVDKYGLEMVCKAPSWDVVIVSHEKKSVCKTPFNIWLSKHKPEMGVIEKQQLVGTKTLLGRKCSAYKEAPTTDTPQIEYFWRIRDKKEEVANKDAKSPTVTFVNYVFNEFPLDTHVAWAVDVLYGYLLRQFHFPVCNQLLLQRVSYTDHGLRGFDVRTISIDKLPPARVKIEYPDVHGLETSDLGPLVMDGDHSRHTANDIFEQLRLGEPLGPGGKTEAVIAYAK